MTKYKYNEDAILKEVKEYIDATYGEHYVAKDIQVIDVWESLGSLDTTARDTAIKYLSRYGKKGGRNKKDLLKAIHYIILMMYADTPKQVATQSLDPTWLGSLSTQNLKPLSIADIKPLSSAEIEKLSNPIYLKPIDINDAYEKVNLNDTYSWSQK